MEKEAKLLIEEKPLKDPLPQQVNNDIIKPRIQNITGFLEVVTVQPQNTPTKVFESIKIWNDSGTLKLCIYDYKGHAWYYVTLTAI